MVFRIRAFAAAPQIRLRETSFCLGTTGFTALQICPSAFIFPVFVKNCCGTVEVQSVRLVPQAFVSWSVPTSRLAREILFDLDLLNAS